MIKAIIFDFGQTLVDSADGFRFAEKIAKEKIFLNLFPSADKNQWQTFLTEYRQIRKSFHEKSNFSRPAIWQAACDRFNCRADLRKFAQMETEYWELVKSRTTAFPETINVLEKLAKEFQLGIITALFPDIEKFFSTIIIAGEFGVPAKPDLQPFLLCLERMKIKPTEAIYVGDDFQKDVCGADYAGLHPVWIKHSLVKRSWPDPGAHTHAIVITNLNELLEININRLDP